MLSTGKSFSEERILASTNPYYDKGVFIELWVQYMKIPSSEHVVYIYCSKCQNKNIKKPSCVHKMFWEWNFHVLNSYYSMNDLLSYCGLVDARISASDKKLPVIHICIYPKRNMYFFSKYQNISLWHSTLWQNTAEITVAKLENHNFICCDDQTVEMLHDF